MMRRHNRTRQGMLMLGILMTVISTACKKAFKTVDVYMTESAVHITAKHKIGTCIFYRDFTYDIKVEDTELQQTIAHAFDLILKEKKAYASISEKDGTTYLRKTRQVSMDDAHFIYAFFKTAEKHLNLTSQGRLIFFTNIR